MIIRPEAVASDENKTLFISPKPSSLSAELTLMELEKKKIKNKGKYIGKRSSVSGLKVRTAININL